MTQQQKEQLLGYLKEHGFEGQRLGADIGHGIDMQLPRFTVQHHLKFGEDEMSFVLRFERDDQFDAYRLNGYRAAHRMPVLLDHETINGIPTAVLERQMAGIDWENFFSREPNQPAPAEHTFVYKVMADLRKLSENNNYTGREIQEKLMYKYWPEDQLNDTVFNEWRSVYGRSREFGVTPGGICHANLAYQLLSGHLDDVHEMLSRCGLEALTPDLYEELCRQLTGLPESFDIMRHQYTGEGHAQVSVPVYREQSGHYRADQYTVAVSVYPAIEHGIYSGVDTRELEAKVAAIDWMDDTGLVKEDEEGGLEFLPHLQGIIDLLYRLGQDPQGRVAADLLLLKYSSNGNFLEMLADDRTWDYEKSLPKICRHFPTETPTTVACNLLYGRAVPEDYLIPCTPPNDHWIRLDVSNSANDGYYTTKAAGNFSSDELGEMLSLLPAEKYRLAELKRRLLMGERAMVALGTGLDILVEVVPEQKTLQLYAADGRPIPVNLSFSPDWKPRQEHQDRSWQVAQSSQQKHRKRNHFRKGRGHP